MIALKIFLASTIEMHGSKPILTRHPRPEIRLTSSGCCLLAQSASASDLRAAGPDDWRAATPAERTRSTARFTGTRPTPITPPSPPSPPSPLPPHCLKVQGSAYT
jgi:hypothetical protein